MTFYDLCCGTGAITLRLLGARAKPLPMIGCKRDFAEPILGLMGVLGRRPRRIVMADCGPWGTFWRTVAERGLGRTVAARIEDFEADGIELFDRLAAAPVPTDPVSFAAVFACLQLANARGRAVQAEGGRWITHGYGHVSQSGRDRRFGERLSRRRLSRRVRRIAGLQWPPVRVVTKDLRRARIRPGPDDVVYIDAPYQGTTGYHGRDLDRAGLITLAERWSRRGALVATSERQPLGWAPHALQLRPSRGRSPGLKARVEWLTMNQPPHRRPTQLPLLGVGRG